MSKLEQRLKKIKTRCESATGPWFHTHVFGGEEVLHYADGRQIAAFQNAADPDFIAHARQDVPMLLEMVEMLIVSIVEVEKAKPGIVEIAEEMFNKILEAHDV